MEIIWPAVILIIAILVAYIIYFIYGVKHVLRAGGQTAHENYPKVVREFVTGTVTIILAFFLFILTLKGFIPKDLLKELVLLGVGAYGAIKIKEKFE